MMRSFQVKIVLLLLAVIVRSCQKPDPGPDPVPDPDPEATVTLDELADMEVYEEGMIVDSRYFKEERTERVVLNDTAYGSPVSLDLSGAGYYRIEIFISASAEENPEVVRLVILDPERGQAEWGLSPWTPAGVEFTGIGTQTIQTVHPRSIPPGQPVPLIVLVGGKLAASLENLEASAGSNLFRVKRGAGSVWFSSEAEEALEIDNRRFPVPVDTMTGPATSLSGELSGDIYIPSGSHVHVPSDLSIPAGGSLTIDSGSFVVIDPEVNIYNNGAFLIRGTAEDPVTLTCSDPETYWGGVIGKGTENRVEASHAIFGRSGFHTGGAYDWGHAHRQALFYCENGSLSLDHCYMIDHIGQVLYTKSASLELEYCLVQRAKTGGQLNYSQVSISYSVFSDFPDDLPGYRDEDNDALYLVECDALVSRSLFMFAKDDGLDSGSGGQGGNVRVENSRFESIFHEGAALSGGSDVSKIHRFSNCVFTDCGQGLELGFSGRGHHVYVDSCLFQRNGIGIRYGDNYTFPNNGHLWVANSLSLDNESHDVWNMDREDWIADTFHMEFDNVWVSKGNPMYPQLKIRE